MAPKFDDYVRRIAREKPWSPVFAFVGTEELLQREGIELLERAVFGGEEPGLGRIVLDGPANRNELSSLPLAAVLDELDTLPFLAPRKLVLVRNADAFASAHAQALARYLEDPAEGAVLALSLDKLDMRTGLGKNLSKREAAVKCAPLWATRFGETETSAASPLGRWIARRARARKLRLAGEAIVSLIENVGSSLAELDAEVEKLALRFGPKAEVRAHDVERVTGGGGEAAFAFTDAVFAGDAAGAVAEVETIFHAGLAGRAGRVVLDEGAVAVALVARLAGEAERRVSAARLLAAGDREGAGRALGRMPAPKKARVLGGLARARPFAPVFRRLLEADRALKTGTPSPRLEATCLARDLAGLMGGTREEKAVRR